MNVMIIGAHPDDPEVMLGGTTARYVELGHSVTMVSMTNGDSGHHEMQRSELAARRRKEADASAAQIGAKYEILPIHDGELMPTLENRNTLIALMRKVNPDIVFTHPMIDYHPDHRYTTQLVLDTSFMLMVPHAVPEVPPIKKNPAYFFSAFRHEMLKGSDPAYCIPIDSVWDKKMKELHQHESQMYEWLPWVEGGPFPVPPADDEKARLEYMNARRSPAFEELADHYRQWLVNKFGDKGNDVKRVEVAIPSPVGRQLTAEEMNSCFPFDV
jgi:LmbE family N-acetylglucosaminyl deacetylase